jgi:autotransporter-associated beta strand protein
LLARIVLGAVAVFLPGAARAQDATWLASPTDGNFNNNVNWTPATVPTGTASFATSNTTSLSFSAATTVGGWTFNVGASNYTFTNHQALTFNGAGIAINGGSATITNNSPGTLNFNLASTAGSATITNNNSLQFNNTSTAGSAFITSGANIVFNDASTAGSATIHNGGLLQFLGDTSTAGNATILNVGDLRFLGATSTAGSATINNNGTTLFTISSTAGSATINNTGTVAFLQFTGTSTAGNAAINNNAGTVAFLGFSTAGNAIITNAQFFPQGSITFSFASTAGNAAITNNSGGVVDFSASIGPSLDNKLSAGSIAGAGGFFLGANQLTVGGNGLSTVVSGAISDGGTGGGIAGSLVKVGTGTLTLSGINSYTGATTVNGGTLEVDGSIAASSLTSVNSSGALTGVGTVGATQINAAGIFMPGSGTAGTSIMVAGNLAFASGAMYLVQVNPATSSFANVTGAATLGGSVQAVFASGNYISKQYTIVSAGSVSGTFGSLVNTNLPANFSDTLSYDATHAFLNLALNFVPPPGQGLNGNQQGVGNAIINFFNSNGSIPMVFGGLTPAGLTQISGETATGSQQTTFDAMGQFMGLLTDPFMGRGGGFNAAPGASGYAEEALGYAANKRTDAFAMFTKAPPGFEPRWSVWAAGFGGSQSTGGNAAVGSNNTTSNIAATAVGADYLISPTTIAGFALAGGGTNFSVANGGTGRSDLFQAGAYVRHTNGPAYISAALAYGWQDITTNRNVTVAGLDQLRAEFNANAYSGRLEGGYRFVSPATFGIGIAPYAAAQFVTFDLPAYSEQAIMGANNFALAYGGRDVTDARSELGFRTDKSFALSDGILTLRGRFAWAHDFDPDRSIAATFQALPGASFVVNGAARAGDSALTTASIEMKWKNGWSVAATFEGEFSDVTSSYAGKGVVRYVW